MSVNRMSTIDRYIGRYVDISTDISVDTTFIIRRCSYEESPEISVCVRMDLDTQTWFGLVIHKDLTRGSISSLETNNLIGVQKFGFYQRS